MVRAWWTRWPTRTRRSSTSRKRTTSGFQRSGPSGRRPTRKTKPWLSAESERRRSALLVDFLFPGLVEADDRVRIPPSGDFHPRLAGRHARYRECRNPRPLPESWVDAICGLVTLANIGSDA